MNPRHKYSRRVALVVRLAWVAFLLAPGVAKAVRIEMPDSIRNSPEDVQRRWLEEEGRKNKELQNKVGQARYDRRMGRKEEASRVMKDIAQDRREIILASLEERELAESELDRNQMAAIGGGVLLLILGGGLVLLWTRRRSESEILDTMQPLRREARPDHVSLERDRKGASSSRIASGATGSSKTGRSVKIDWEIGKVRTPNSRSGDNPR